MKKSYKFDTTLGIIKAECASIKDKEYAEHMKLERIELPNGTPELVFEASKIVVDLSLSPLKQFAEKEICLYSEDNTVKVTEVLFFDDSSINLLIPFDEFEKFFFDYKRVVFN